MDLSLLWAVLAALLAIVCFVLLYRTTKVDQAKRKGLFLQVFGLMAVMAIFIVLSIEQ
ncbi:hypothetical protein FBY33_3065 [Arthrobacter sp. SLBN-112]|jgi:hypothetical protein|nr:hypothetical protein FBY33_0356 [Arthrobacter sp. SLBN-112]TQJ40968.1 hypothetical protein FBY33_3065 [Arthrobacter sp. SLBN-112]